MAIGLGDLGRNIWPRDVVDGAGALKGNHHPRARADSKRDFVNEDPQK
jgi:hypothetical protein